MPATSDDVLILELGGETEPLREALRRVVPREEPEREPEREETAPAARVPPAVQPEFFTVYLREGETVYRLAATHLGSGSRSREILNLNGWTEAQAGQLEVGTPVKLPIR